MLVKNRTTSEILHRNSGHFSLNALDAFDKFLTEAGKCVFVDGTVFERVS